jgi:hypothetical protein
MCEPRGGIHAAQHFPRQALRDEAHRNLVGVEAERFSQRFEERLLINLKEACMTFKACMVEIVCMNDDKK